MSVSTSSEHTVWRTTGQWRDSIWPSFNICPRRGEGSALDMRDTVGTWRVIWGGRMGDAVTKIDLGGKIVKEWRTRWTSQLIEILWWTVTHRLHVTVPSESISWLSYLIFVHVLIYWLFIDESVTCHRWFGCQQFRREAQWGRTWTHVYLFTLQAEPCFSSSCSMWMFELHHNEWCLFIRLFA